MKAGAATSRLIDQPATILLIEDNAEWAGLIRELLADESHGAFTIEWVDRLAAGIDRLRRGGVDLVVLDLELPDSPAAETFCRLQAAAPDVAVVVLTGTVDEAFALGTVHGGAQDYLLKTEINGPALARAIRHARERHRLQSELRRANAQMWRELAMAREVQRALLPPAEFVFPAGAAPGARVLQFQCRYQPTAVLGGDFFDVWTVADGQAGVFICDVTGHGVQAALVTALVRGLLEDLNPIATDPSRLLGALNRDLHRMLQTRDLPILTTAFYLVADPARGLLRCANAGHPCPLLCQRATGAVQPLPADRGPVLGMLDDAAYPSYPVTMADGDAVLLFTDGLYEVPVAGAGEYGRDRLRMAVQRRCREPLAPLCDALLAEVAQFAGGQPFHDDVCLIGMEMGDGTRSPTVTGRA